MIEGKKFDKEKPRLELISAIATYKKAKVMTFGAEKYGVDNWRGGLAWSRVIGAMLRHTFSYMLGEENDPETGESHMAHIACCADFLLEYEVTHRELDDRYKPLQQRTASTPNEVQYTERGMDGFKDVTSAKLHAVHTLGFGKKCQIRKLYDNNRYAWYWRDDGNYGVIINVTIVEEFTT